MQENVEEWKNQTKIRLLIFKQKFESVLAACQLKKPVEVVTSHENNLYFMSAMHVDTMKLCICPRGKRTTIRVISFLK